MRKNEQLKEQKEQRMTLKEWIDNGINPILGFRYDPFYLPRGYNEKLNPYKNR